MFQQAISRVKKNPTHIYFYSHKAKYNGIEKYTNYIYTKTKCIKQIIVMEKRANAKVKVDKCCAYFPFHEIYHNCDTGPPYANFVFCIVKRTYWFY